jgi:hypothetical protein
MTDTSDLFVDLLDATMRSSRNYHRLDHCSHVDGSRPKSVFRFKEETITDLLIGELAGREYQVYAACPVCGPDRQCSDWDGDPAQEASGIRIRALTKHEEGGDRRTGKAGAHADFILAIRCQGPGRGRRRADARELRIMVQAKRANPSQPKFRPDPEQYDKFVEAAGRYGAVPYYALYVQQPGPHESAPTACPRAQSASDRSVVLAAARPSADPGALPGRSLAAILGDARPLRCLADCTCFDPGASPSKQLGPEGVWNATLRFIGRDFPGYRPVSSESALPRNVPRVRTNLYEYKPPRASAASRYRLPRPGATAGNPGKDEVLLIRLGTLRRSLTPDRRFIGYAPDMSREDLRDAARMYWRLDGERAGRVRYLVISANREVLDACEVAPDGLTFVEDADGSRRVAFAITDIADSGLKQTLLAMATHKLGQLRPGTRNPFIYLGDDATN